MAKNIVLNKFFSSGLQAFAVQILGILFFYFISLGSKENLGLFSWANALCMFLTTILSFGMEQVVVRRISVSKLSDWAASAFLFHSFISSLLMLLVLFIIHLLFKNSVGLQILPFFFIAQAILYTGSPLKQFLNAKEKFTPYGVIALLSNIGKIIIAFLLVRKNQLSINNIVIVMICFAVFEIAGLLWYILTKRQFNFTFKFKFTAYKKLLKESAPQYLAVIFDSSLSRMDWILLGFISTSVITADYAFAYRAFEMARLPIAIIAPVILPVFSRMLHQHNKFDTEKRNLVMDIFIIEMFLATGLFLSANILWTPVILQITHGKYGASNGLQFFILSLCIPLHFFINLLWTLSFAGKRYRNISVITIISAVTNTVLNLILIPLYGGAGAAISFLIASIIQAGCYVWTVKKELISFPVMKLVLFYLIAAGVYLLGYFITVNIIMRLFCSAILYVAFCIILQQIGRKQLGVLKSLFS